MQFKYPEFLLALLFLLIPVIIHLFRFRRFKTEYFTNVRFLKEITQKSRKSSQLKKWLILLMRMLALAFLVLAFAQPYKPHDASYAVPEETLVYIDNSRSMQQDGEQGELLKQAVQDVVQYLPEDKRVTVLTNDRVYKEATIGALKNELLKIDYAEATDDFNTVLLRAQDVFSERGPKQKQLIALSDFQQKNFGNRLKADSTLRLDFVQYKGGEHPNFSIDSLSIESSDAEMIQLKAFLSASQKVDQRLTVDLYRGDEVYAKNNGYFSGDKKTEVEFSIPRDLEIKKGRLQISDRQLTYDNVYYFSLQHTHQIKVASLGEAPENQTFLQRIFKDDQFELELQLRKNLNYTQFEDADFIVLNELEKFPAGMTNILKKHLERGGSIAVIPARKIDLENYNNVLLNLHSGTFSSFRSQPLKITDINFSHPLYSGVFENPIKNFQYPEVKGYYPYKGGEGVLNYNNGEDFLARDQRIYLFTSPLNKEETNFKQSPLIVPTFYNMALQSAKIPQLAYRIGDSQKVDAKTALSGDVVVHLKKEEIDMIPPQRRFQDKVELDISTYPDEAGLYNMDAEGTRLGVLAFNYSRAESDLRFKELEEEKDVHWRSSLKQLMDEEEYKEREDSYWKWFAIFALVFVFGEFLLLRFLK